MDIKARLREAREAIKNKNFIKSIDICESILCEDADNYLALVFLGVSILETNSTQQCEKIFRKAIEVNPESLLAWNGLANYFEKQDTSEAKLELIKIYTFLIARETNEKKLSEYCDKLCSLYRYTNVGDICKLIYNKVENGNYSETTLINSRSSLANMLKQNNELSDDILEVYEDILSSLIKNTETITPDYYSQYLTVLYKQEKLEILLTHVMKMYKLFPEDIASLNWICQLYNELYVENRFCSTFESVNIKCIYEDLINKEPKNYVGIFTKAIYEVEQGELNEAKKDLEAVVADKPSLLHAWILLSKVNTLVHAYSDAIDSANFAKKLLLSTKCECSVYLNKKILCLLLEALSRSSEASDWEKATEHFEQLDKRTQDKCLIHYTRANIKLGNMAEAKKSVLFLEESSDTDDMMPNILNAQLLRRENMHKTALNILTNNPKESSEYFLELGITYFETNQLDKCLLPFLKAAKADPNNYYCFFYLGCCYREMREYQKARRCFERAYNLCPSYSDAAMELSRIYRLLKNWDDNAALLQVMTKENINKQNMWAWMQMGLNLLEQGNYEDAINYLRLVSRIDTENAHCWESLADAYLASGAYTSAQKAYECALELSGDTMYPALQIATIKKELGHLQEAISDFEELLRKNKNCILTLTGLAETCLKKARECYTEQRLGTARDYAQYGVEVVTKAIQQCSEISCVWKILADCCMLVSQLPEKYCCLLVVRALDEGLSVEGQKIMERDDLMHLAARCYCKASVLTKDNQLIWHDLAVCYFLQSKHSEDKEVVKDNLTRARAIVQHCTSLNPKYWPFWNLLGNIVIAQDPPNYALAQHSFIKAVVLYRNCAVAWTNLGVLYFKMGNIKLANSAFAQAQRADPNYVQSWIGQALLAETVGQDAEAMDLFRHSTSLGFHPQGALGYGDWVCRKLIETPPDDQPYVIHKLHAIPVACDALTWYTEKEPYCCCAWNMLGILKERMGLLTGAEEAFKKALNLSTLKCVDLARINYGRALTRLSCYKEAIEELSEVQESSFNSGIWYALSLYKDTQFQESSSIYLAIAQYLAKDKLSIGDVVACMAIIKYVLGEPELAKKTIIESFAQRLPTARVMYALIALGVLQGDKPLVSLTLKQVDILEDVSKSVEEFASLLSYVHLYQGNYIKAIRKTSELIHLLPNKSGLWLTLALVLLYSIKYTKLPSQYTKYAKAAFKAANVALELKSEKATHQEVSKILCTISASNLLLQDNNSALIAAQKAVHCTPNVKECWVVLNESLAEFPRKIYAYQLTTLLLSLDSYEHITSNTIF